MHTHEPLQSHGIAVSCEKKKRRNGSLDGNLDVKNEYDPMFKLWLVAANILNSHMVSESI